MHSRHAYPRQRYSSVLDHLANHAVEGLDPLGREVLVAGVDLGDGAHQRAAVAAVAVLLRDGLEGIDDGKDLRAGPIASVVKPSG